MWAIEAYCCCIWKFLRKTPFEMRSNRLSLTRGNSFCWHCARGRDGWSVLLMSTTHSREIFEQVSLHDSASHACNWLHRKRNSKSCSESQFRALTENVVNCQYAGFQDAIKTVGPVSGSTIVSVLWKRKRRFFLAKMTFYWEPELCWAVDQCAAADTCFSPLALSSPEPGVFGRRILPQSIISADMTVIEGSGEEKIFWGLPRRWNIFLLGSIHLLLRSSKQSPYKDLVN